MLIVDDDATTRVLARASAESAGLVIDEAESGARGIDQFQREPYDLVVLDVVMPELDGFAVCRAIRELPRGQHVPVLIMTGLADVRSIERAYEAGATDFVTKPIHWAVFGHRARYLIRAGAALRSLHESQLAADAANAAKTSFLRNMSHEIRTPMTAILGWVELLLDEKPEPSTHEALEVVQRTGRHLLGLLDTILDLSRLEAGELRIERQELSLPDLVRDVCGLLSAQARAKGVEVEMSCAAAVPGRVVADPLRLRQILLNLLGNALKFTERGSVRLAVDVERIREDGRTVVRFAVEDTGIGIRGIEVERLFEPFVQADDSMTRRFGGSGLGLTISRALARAFGGDVRAEPLPLGSRFTLTLPVQVAAAPAAARTTRQAAAPQGSRGRVLLAEDNRDNARILSTMLQLGGWRVELAEDGRVCVDRALAARDAGEPFDVILLDLQMPVLDGLEAARRLRAAGYDGPIAALTAHVLAQDEQNALAAGCNAFARKPIGRIGLLALLSRIVGEQETRDQPGSDTALPVPQPTE